MAAECSHVSQLDLHADLATIVSHGNFYLARPIGCITVELSCAWLLVESAEGEIVALQ